MPKQAKQRFVDLAVGEVSLVDSPANEKEFIVVKSLNQEDVEMAEAATDVNKTGGETDVETVPVEVAKATSEAVEKAMNQVTELVENIAKLAQPSNDDATGDDADVNKADDAELPSDVDIEKGLTKEQKEKRGTMREKLEKQLSAKGMKGDALKTAVDVAMRTLAGQGAFKPGASTKPPESVKGTKKSGDGAEGADGDVAGDVQPADTQAVVAETIKQISSGLQGAQVLSAPEAQKALKAAVETLQALLKQVSMQPIPAGTNPKNTLPSSTSFGASGIKEITKSLEGLQATLGELKDTAKSLTDRVEDIEKTRQPSTSGGGSDGTTTQETKKSIWSGVL